MTIDGKQYNIIFYGIYEMKKYRDLVANYLSTVYLHCIRLRLLFCLNINYFLNYKPL